MWHWWLFMFVLIGPALLVDVPRDESITSMFSLLWLSLILLCHVQATSMLGLLVGWCVCTCEYETIFGYCEFFCVCVYCVVSMCVCTWSLQRWDIVEFILWIQASKEFILFSLLLWGWCLVFSALLFFLVFPSFTVSWVVFVLF